MDPLVERAKSLATEIVALLRNDNDEGVMLTALAGAIVTIAITADDPQQIIPRFAIIVKRMLDEAEAR